jgi:hypothetical protein
MFVKLAGIHSCDPSATSMADGLSMRGLRWTVASLTVAFA